MTPSKQTPAEVAAVHATGEHPTTPSGEGEMTWHLWGEGEPVVFLHGGMGSWMHWIRNIPELRRHTRMLVPDIPGHMDSAKPSQPYSPESVASVLVAGIDRLIGASQQYCVVGFSFGSVIGGHVARLGGERVRKLVLVSMSGTGLPRGTMPELRKWRNLTSETERVAAHRHNLQVGMISNPAHVDDLAVYIHAESTQRAQPVSAPISLGNSLQACLPEVKAGLAAIWGAHDPASSPYMAERREFLQRIQPDTPMVIIDDASHWVQYEAAAAFDAALLRLLRGSNHR